MSRSILRTLAVVALAASTIAPRIAKAELKIGYVDLQRALLEVEEGRQAKARLQSVLEAKQKDIDKEQEQLRKDGETLQKQQSAMSEETFRQKQIELQKRLFDLQQKWDKSRQEMAQKEHTELQAIFAKMDPIIAQIANNEGMTMVFEKTDSGLVFAPASLDITNELVRMYNDKNKSGAGTGTSPGTKPSGGKAPAADAPKKK